MEELRAAGLMTPAGNDAVAAAQTRGTWDVLNEVEQLTEPEDLARALDEIPAARSYWDAFPRSTKRAILEWVASAKTDGTRQTRVTRTAQEAAVNVRANQWRQPSGGKGTKTGGAGGR